MAEEEAAKETEETEGTGEKKSNKMLLIIIVVVVILLILLGVIGVLLMSGDDEEMQQVRQEQVQQNQKPMKSRSASSGPMEMSRQLSEIGILYPLDTFTVNLKSDSGRRYLKTTMSLELQGEELSLELDAKTPVIRDRIIRILSSKTLEEISSKKGKAKTSAQIMEILNSMISDGRIQGIYFTEFVIQ